MKTLSIYNPGKQQLQFPHDTFTRVWDRVVEKGLQNETHFVFEFMVNDEDEIKGTGTVSLVKWEFEMQYLKAKCFDEAKDLPYKMPEKVLDEAFMYVGAIKERWGMCDFVEWLEKIVKAEREEYIKQYKRRKS